MEIDTKSFSCDIIIEEKFIPDDIDEEHINDHEVPNVNLDQIDQTNHQNEDNWTENNAKSQLSNVQLYKCKCNKRYKTSRMFKQHKKICQFQNNNLILCRVFKCYATFDNKNDYDVHKLKGHSKPISKNSIGIFLCDFEGCTAEFSTKRGLNQHKISVHVPRKYACLYCDLTFKIKSNKSRHEQKMHLKKPKNQRKMTKKLNKSIDFQIKNGPKINTKVEKIEKSEVRITRSGNKKKNFTSFFTLEKNTDGNQSESDGESSFDEGDIDGEDISIKASSDSDSDENDQVLKVSKREKNQNDLLESEEYLCSRCNKSFTKKLDAQNHEKNCQNSKKYERVKVQVKNFEIACEYEDCDNVFTDMEKYNKHIDLVHLMIPKTKNRVIRNRDSEDRGCFLCRKSFKLKKDLDEHMKIPHKINCSRIFVESAQLERHIKYNHLEDLKKFQCLKCIKKFMTKFDLQRHNQIVHDKKMKICPICSNEVGIYKFTEHLKSHKKNGGAKSFCKSCQVYLTNKLALEKHRGTELHLKQKSDDNNEEFILPHDLNTVDSFLIDKKPDEGIFDPVKDKKVHKRHISKCHDCDLKFRNFNFKEAHLVKVHGYQKPQFRCTICDMNFSRQSVLNVHIKKSISHKMKEKELRKD